MVPLALALAGAVGSAPARAGGTIRVDLSSTDPTASNYPVARIGRNLCVEAPSGSVLAAAIVTYGRRPGRSAWGHTSIRFMACEEGQLHDVEYEYYRMDNSIERWFGKVHEGQDWTTDHRYLRTQRGQLMVVRNERPVDGGFYAVELSKNREVVEAWMPWSPELKDRLYAELSHRYEAQIDRLQQRKPLDGYEYKPMGTNCTLHVREALALEAGADSEWLGSVFPMRNLRDLEARDDVRLVLHPSSHVLRQTLDALDTPPTVSRIPHGLVRLRMTHRQKAALREALPGAEPVVVEWLREGALSDGTLDRAAQALDPR